ncbi:hypothetical protein [Spirillospora sp. NPDC047279]|uniref:hypothetical protein n=1 Tax=Spirillospora sp. NPDC047279 TaxID=3155478 RepID=UPI0033EF825F
MRGPTGKAFRTWWVTTVLVTVLGPFAGLLWAAVAPAVEFVVVQGEPVFADPEGQGPIGVDGRYTLIVAVAAIACGGLAYLRGGRGNDVPLILGLAAGGIVAAVIAMKVGHQIGLSDYEAAVRRAKDGATVTGVAELRATGLVTVWPILAVGTYGVLELIVKRLPAGDRGEPGAGEPDEVAGGKLDLEAAPAGGDVDRREP